MYKPLIAILALLTAPLAGCTTDSKMPTELTGERPCVANAQVTRNGISSSCSAGFIFDGEDYGIAKLDYEMNLARGCDDMEGKSQMAKMGNVRVTVNESTGKVEFASPEGKFGIMPGQGMDVLFVRSADRSDPNDRVQLINCSGLDQFVKDLANEGKEDPKAGCAGDEPQNGSTRSAAFDCPALTAYAQTTGLYKQAFMMQNKEALAQVAMGHVLATDVQDILQKQGGPKRAQVVAILAVIIQVAQVAMEVAKFAQSFDKGSGQSGMPMGAYQSSYKRR